MLHEKRFPHPFERAINAKAEFAAIAMEEIVLSEEKICEFIIVYIDKIKVNLFCSDNC